MSRHTTHTAADSELVTQLAQIVAKNDARVDSVENAIAALANTVNQGFKEVREDITAFVKFRKTNWSNVAAWAGVAVAILLAAIGGLFAYIRLMQVHSDTINEIRWQHNAETRSLLWTQIQSQVAELSKSDASQVSKIEGLDAQVKAVDANSATRYGITQGRIDMVKLVLADLFEEVRKRPLPSVSDPDRAPRASDAIPSFPEQRR